ncbi:MAG: hypothetical protein JKY48_19580 [Flavobacteriales bacterium]|nr:hypothetical protein [Flavobacteriales bacterium]
MKFLLKLICIFFSIQLPAQREINVGEMNFQYEIIQDSIYVFLNAPTKGWIMLGFNSNATINGADLKFFKVENNIPLTSDRKNTGGRNYPSDTELGGENNIRIIQGIETIYGTSFYFILPLQTGDQNDFQFEEKEAFWLILAYSEEDDFQHHSRMRKHLPFSWEP